MPHVYVGDNEGSSKNTHLIIFLSNPSFLFPSGFYRIIFKDLIGEWCISRYSVYLQFWAFGSFYFSHVDKLLVYFFEKDPSIWREDHCVRTTGTRGK